MPQYHGIPIPEPKELNYQQNFSTQAGLSHLGGMNYSEGSLDLTISDLIEVETKRCFESHRDFLGRKAKLEMFEEKLGHLHVHDPSLLRHLRQFLYELSKTRKPATIARYRAALSSMFNSSIYEGLINFNPVKAIAKPKESAPRNRFLSEIEIAAFIRACLADENRSHALMLLLCLYTGLRSGNVRSIQLSWLFDDDTRLEIPMTKSGKPHTAYLSTEAQQVVKEARQYARNGYLFPATRGDGYMSKPTKLFKRILARMEEEGALTAPFVIHDLRRSMASHLLKATSDIRLVQQMLGHADVRTTERYAYHADDTLKNASQVAADAMLSAHKSH